MPRTFIVRKKTSFAALGKTMLDARVKDDRAATALNELREANPHVGAELKPGTVIIVPDTPGLKPSAGEPASNPLRESLQGLVEKALAETAQRSEARLGERRARRAEMVKTINSPGFKRAAASAHVSAAPFQQAAKALADDDKKDQEAAERLAGMSAAALAALARLDRLGR